jgi:hypothetical protein
MATLSIAPTNPRVNVPLIIDGDGFAVSTKVTLSCQEGLHAVDTLDIVTDASGSFSTSDEADPAINTITSSGVQVTANDTVTVNGRVYTFKASVTTTADEIFIGATAAATLQNLKDALNLTGTPGTQYGSLTTIHATVSAGDITATTLLLFAKTGGTGGNSLTLAKSAVTLSVTGATFAGGAAATGRNAIVLTPDTPGPYTFTATDGTSTATAKAQVFT